MLGDLSVGFLFCFDFQIGTCSRGAVNCGVLKAFNPLWALGCAPSGTASSSQQPCVPDVLSLPCVPILMSGPRRAACRNAVLQCWPLLPFIQAACPNQPEPGHLVSVSGVQVSLCPGSPLGKWLSSWALTPGQLTAPPPCREICLSFNSSISFSLEKSLWYQLKDSFIPSCLRNLRTA